MRATGASADGEPLVPISTNEVFSTLTAGDTTGRAVLYVAGGQG
jgi:hypothetical protein